MQGRAAVPGSTSSPLHSEVIEAEPEGIDHSHLILRFEHARSTHYSEGLIPFACWANDPRIAYRSINARVGTVDKARRSRGRSQNVLPDSFGLSEEIAPDRIEQA
jgi:hypothetical protein